MTSHIKTLTLTLGTQLEVKFNWTISLCLHLWPAFCDCLLDSLRMPYTCSEVNCILYAWGFSFLFFHLLLSVCLTKTTTTTIRPGERLTDSPYIPGLYLCTHIRLNSVHKCAHTHTTCATFWFWLGWRWRKIWQRKQMLTAATLSGKVCDSPELILSCYLAFCEGQTPRPWQMDSVSLLDSKISPNPPSSCLVYHKNLAAKVM